LAVDSDGVRPYLLGIHYFTESNMTTRFVALVGSVLFVGGSLGCGSSGSKPADGAANDAPSAEVAGDAATPSDRVSDTAIGERPPSPDLAPVAAGNRYFVYAGGDRGIDILYMDPGTGALSAKSWIDRNPAAGFVNASFLTVDQTRKVVYAVSEHQGSVNKIMAYAIDPLTGYLTLLNDQDTGVFPLMPDGKLGASAGSALTCTNPHGVFPEPSGKGVYVPCLLSNMVWQFSFTPQTGKLTPKVPIVLPEKPGPRHMDISEDGRFAYLVKEFTQTISVYSIDTNTGLLIEPPLQTDVSTLPTSVKPDNKALRGRAAAIALHPSLKTLYVTTRLDKGTPDPLNPSQYVFDQTVLEGYLTTFSVALDGKLTFVASEKVNREPRGMSIDPAGRYLLVSGVSAETDNLLSFTVDGTNGMLTKAGAATVPQHPNIVGIANLQ
jgi:6-phosphogluconolactonase (cycloisomerase 2 family)